MTAGSTNAIKENIFNRRLKTHGAHLLQSFSIDFKIINCATVNAAEVTVVRGISVKPLLFCLDINGAHQLDVYQ